MVILQVNYIYPAVVASELVPGQIIQGLQL